MSHSLLSSSLQRVSLSFKCGSEGTTGIIKRVLWEVPCNQLASGTWWVGENKPPWITLSLKRIYKKSLKKKNTWKKLLKKKACLCLNIWDFMPNSFISPKPQQVRSIKQHSQNGNNRELQPFPYLEASHRDSSSRVEMGARRFDLGEDWLVLWTCAGGRVLYFFLALSLCNHSSLPPLAWEIQMSKAAIPLQHYSWVELIPIALRWALLSTEAFGSGQKG